jgi:hypothetical protein
MREFVLGVVVCVAVPASLAGCHDVDSSEAHVREDRTAIMGGTKASAYPESVLIDMKQNGQIKAACSGAVIAPRVVLTAGHCVYRFEGWNVRAPYAGGQAVTAAESARYDWTEKSESVNPHMHDVGLIFLDQPISLASYPTLASAPLADGATILNVGRIRDGVLSHTDLFVSKPISVTGAADVGFPLDYEATDVIEPGDSGGPDILPGSHVIAAVNSGSGNGSEVLARVDLVRSWIQQQIASHGVSAAPAAVACAHDVCAEGKKLVSGCDSCSAKVCAEDAYCCGTRWDAQCVGEAASLCAEATCSGASDPCKGVSFEGECQADTVVWCESNALHVLDCAGSGTCGLDTSSGIYDCL